MVIFLVLPWVKLNGQQILLLNIAERKFNIFGLHFWGHDAPILALVLLSFLFTMGLVTAVFGRVWCGWACPQTVFIDLFYRRIEEWIEGSPAQRRRLNSGPWTREKLLKKLASWTLYIMVSLLITHSFLAYFVGTERLLEMIQHSPAENPTSFIVIVISTTIILFDFAWFREQFCIIACPYGRLQSVLMSKESLVVGYDQKRGEPRLKDRHDTSSTGDCINCYRCVQVCPTGIDIRRGTQLECIMCTACIDACDQVMVKLNKPKGLVRYDTELGLEGKKTPIIRGRIIIYFLLIVVAVSLLSFIISNRDLSPIHVTRDRHKPYIEMNSSTILNHFRISIRNQYLEPISVSFKPGITLLENKAVLTMPIPTITVPAGTSGIQEIFVQFPSYLTASGKKEVSLIQVITTPAGTKEEKIRKVVLLGPKSN